MIELLPVYRQYVFWPMFYNPNAKITDVQPDRTLIWLLRPLGGGFHSYICQNALAVNAREEEASTPPFHPTRVNDRSYIPQYVLDWMNRFAKVMQIGAAYGRQK